MTTTPPPKKKKLPLGVAFAVVLLAIFELKVARKAWIWDFDEYSSTGTITALERRIIAPGPAPKIVLLGNSRMRDAIAPRGLETELGCAKGTAMNLAVSAGGVFEAIKLYERNRAKLSKAEVVVLDVDTWYFDGSEPPTMNVHRFGTVSERLQGYPFSETANLLVGWVWRTYDVRPRIEGVFTAYYEDRRGSRLSILPDGRVKYRRDKGDDGPSRIRIDTHELEKYQFSPKKTAELGRFIDMVRADGPKVLLVALPLRDEYVDVLEKRFEPIVEQFEEELGAFEDRADVLIYRRGTDAGVPKTGFYDYGHMSPSGSRLMTPIFASYLLEQYGVCSP